MALLSLSLSRNGWPASTPAPGALYILGEEEADAPAQRLEPRRKVSAVTDHDRGIMRDLVLGAFLGAQHFREDDGTYVAPYTTETTRDAFPRRLADELGACPTDGGPDGRLPAAYVASLARGTTRVIASETRPKKKAAVPLGPLAFQDARIVREVGRLAPEHQHWIRYAYADSLAWDDEQGAVVALWARYEPELGKVQAKTRKTAQGLAHLAVQNAKRFINAGQDLHHPARLRELLGVTEANWDKHWSPRWQGLKSAALAMDRDALGALCRQLGGFNFVLLDRGL